LSTDAGLRQRLGRLAGRFGRLVPPHAFVLTRDRLVHVALGNAAQASEPTLGGVKIRSAVLPPGSFREGPGGVGIAGPGLSDAIRQVLGKEASSNVAAASLAVPDAFVRVVAVDVEPAGERNAREVEEVLQWKLDRTFGDSAPALRISWQAAGPAPGGGTRILGIGTPEEAATSWEGAFAAHGIRIGMIAPEVLAIAPVAKRALGGAGLLVWAHGGTVSTAFFAGGALRFLRSKSEDPDPGETVQEIRLFASFVAAAGADAGGEGAGAAVAGPESSSVVSGFIELRKENGASEPIVLRNVLAARGLASGLGDPEVLVGIGLMTEEE
jgi:hypothetical protein